MDRPIPIHELLEIIKNEGYIDCKIDRAPRILFDICGNFSDIHIQIYGDNFHIRVRNYGRFKYVANDNREIVSNIEYEYCIDYHTPNNMLVYSMTASSLDELISTLSKYDLYKEYYIKKAIK